MQLHLKNVEYNENLKKQAPTDNNSACKFICPYCNYNFTTKQALSRHKNHRCSKNNLDELKKEIVELKNQTNYLKNLVEKTCNDRTDVISIAKHNAKIVKHT